MQPCHKLSCSADNAWPLLSRSLQCMSCLPDQKPAQHQTGHRPELRLRDPRIYRAQGSRQAPALLIAQIAGGHCWCAAREVRRLLSRRILGGWCGPGGARHRKTLFKRGNKDGTRMLLRLDRMDMREEESESRPSRARRQLPKKLPCSASRKALVPAVDKLQRWDGQECIQLQVHSAQLGQNLAHWLCPRRHAHSACTSCCCMQQ